MTPDVGAKPDCLSLDFETASTVDLRRTGAAVYARHPSTMVLCMGYRFPGQATKIWRIGQPFPQEVWDHVAKRRPVRAWNAGFELEIWNHTLERQLRPHATPHQRLRPFPELMIQQTYDTMAEAAYYGLPLSLDMAASAARVNVKKDKEGHALMLRMCRPRKTHKDGTTEWWHANDPDKFDRLCLYCIGDVDAECAIGDVLPVVPLKERRLWIEDRFINGRGIGVDLNLVARLGDLAIAAVGLLNTEVKALTRGAVPTVTSTAALLVFVQSQGYPEDNLRKDTIVNRLEHADCVGVERAVLLARQAGARTSAAKLKTMVSAALHDRAGGHVASIQGMLQYYGAFRTGRWAGRLVQLQNLPRPVLKSKQVQAAVDIILNWTHDAKLLAETLELLFGVSAMEVVASLLRSCLCARAGKTLVVADKSQIEARVLPWLAGQEDVLEAFRVGSDVYVQAAAGIFLRTFPDGHIYDKDDIPDDERQIGKVAILALGFGGGVGAFQTMAAGYGVKIADADADRIKVAWRDKNPRIVAFWGELDRALRTVLRDPSQVVKVGAFLQVAKWGAHVIIGLPSKRALVYRDARMIPSNDRPGQDEISYMGLNQYTNKWERVRTYGGKLAENVTQAAARDCMAEVILQAEDAMIEVLLTVHDELITEAPDGGGQAQLDTLLGFMSVPPSWAKGLPVKGAGWHGQRYRK
jgi:DNA polymerase